MFGCVIFVCFSFEEPVLFSSCLFFVPTPFCLLLSYSLLSSPTVLCWWFYPSPCWCFFLILVWWSNPSAICFIMFSVSVGLCFVFPFVIVYWGLIFIILLRLSWDVVIILLSSSIPCFSCVVSMSVELFPLFVQNITVNCYCSQILSFSGCAPVEVLISFFCQLASADGHMLSILWVCHLVVAPPSLLFPSSSVGAAFLSILCWWWCLMSNSFLWLRSVLWGGVLWACFGLVWY